MSNIRDYVFVVFAAALVTVSIDGFKNKIRYVGHKTPINREFLNELTTNFDTKLALLTLSRRNESAVTMPLLVRLALCRLQQAARGGAKEELERALVFFDKKHTCITEVQEILSLLQASAFLTLNKMYVRESKDLNPVFTNVPTAIFGVHLEKLRFSRPHTTQMYINQWFEQASLQRIRDIINEDEINVNYTVLLVSAAHLKSSWEEPFVLLDTKPMKFRDPLKRMTSVPMMTKTESLLYFEDKKYLFKIVSLPLNLDKIWMTFIVPEDPQTLPTLMRMITHLPHVLADARKSMKHTVVTVNIPRFKVKTSTIWDDVVKQLGVKQIFNESYSGLDGMLRSHKDVKNLFVNKIKQQVFMEVDEFGVFRGRLPSGQRMPMLRQRLQVHSSTKVSAERPFLYTVDLQVTPGGQLAELLMGIYYGPDFTHT